MTTLAELLLQREALEAQIAETRHAELANVIAQVKALIEEYGLTVNDVFGGVKRGRKAGSGGTSVAPKYRDPETGATWTGRGKAPKWIDGKDRSQFAI